MARSRKIDALEELRARANQVADEYRIVGADRSLRSVRLDSLAIVEGAELFAGGEVDRVLATQAELEAAATRIEEAVMAREEKSLGPDEAFPSVPGIHRWFVFNLLRDARRVVEARAQKARSAPPRAKLSTEEDLWAIVDAVERKARGDLEASCALFAARLKALDDRSLLRAARLFSALMGRAYRWDLWGAAYVIHGGCSDDGFWDFRAGLVALGRARYERALRDPDGLASIRDVEERTLFEGFQYVPDKVIAERELAPRPPAKRPKKPVGRTWDEDDLPKRFPRLWKRFGDA